MLWALGSFGASDEALHRAIIFAVAGLWCFIATGLALGWAIQGFVIRQKAAEEDSDEPPAASSHRPPPSPPPSGRPPHPSKPSGH
ncbi:hypothetical protein A6A04_17930 [Paramagnetospirillum marisnigri]|uniref:Uncharacterized protein n=2 Tax=Paramagnetospirillum marisnigri TaxID=1285242 RepID=A0A178MR90_9PROT|nr:hypothetical protein A6A04_17930 [Paramagnetospirillum marisnigri]